MGKTTTYQSIKHDDKDLVQLAGYHAYREPEVEKEISVNGKLFRVEHTEYDTSTGLDVLTVRNVTVFDEDGELSDQRNNKGELIVVFVGSEQPKTDWIETNLKLLGDKEPAQLKAAKAYVEEVERDIGKVSSVTGNSLGGASANRVAIDDPSIKSVTFNTAILPDGMVDPTKEYSNITNSPRFTILQPCI